jgi:DNA polymerase
LLANGGWTDVAMFKSVEYDILVSERIECRRCEGLKNPSVVEGGRFDSSEIGPWSRWQGSLDARLMIVGQDWGDLRYFTGHSGREGAANPTNDTLQDLVRLLGIDVGQPGDQRRSGVAFFANAVLCLKDGGLQSRVRPQWFTNCATFLRRQVEIVAPKLLVCLGESSYRGLAAAFAFTPGPFHDVVESDEGIHLPNGTRAFARYHCGRRIQNTHRPLDRQREDWFRLARFLCTG